MNNFPIYTKNNIDLVNFENYDVLIHQQYKDIAENEILINKNKTDILKVLVYNVRCHDFDRLTDDETHSSRIELFFSVKLNEYFGCFEENNENVCRHIVKVYKATTIDDPSLIDKIKSKLNYTKSIYNKFSILKCEYADYNLADYINKLNINETDLIEIIFQVFHTLHLIRQKIIGFIHGDMKPENILMVKDPLYNSEEPKYYEYKYNDKSYYIPVKKYIPKLWDFEFSESNNVYNNCYNHKDKPILMYTDSYFISTKYNLETQLKTDLFRFFCKLFYNLGKIYIKAPNRIRPISLGYVSGLNDQPNQDNYVNVLNDQPNQDNYVNGPNTQDIKSNYVWNLNDQSNTQHNQNKYIERNVYIKNDLAQKYINIFKILRFPDTLKKEFYTFIPSQELYNYLRNPSIDYNYEYNNIIHLNELLSSAIFEYLKHEPKYNGIQKYNNDITNSYINKYNEELRITKSFNTFEMQYDMVVILSAQFVYQAKKASYGIYKFIDETITKFVISKDNKIKKYEAGIIKYDNNDEIYNAGIEGGTASKLYSNFTERGINTHVLTTIHSVDRKKKILKQMTDKSLLILIGHCSEKLEVIIGSKFMYDDINEAEVLSEDIDYKLFNNNSLDTDHIYELLEDNNNKHINIEVYACESGHKFCPKLFSKLSDKFLVSLKCKLGLTDRLSACNRYDQYCKYVDGSCKNTPVIFYGDKDNMKKYELQKDYDLLGGNKNKNHIKKYKLIS